MAIETEDPIDPRLAEALRSLRDTPPPEDLWQGIAPRLAPRLPHGSVLLRWPTAIAAGLVIAVASVAGTALLLDRSSARATSTEIGAVPPAGAGVIAAANTPADAALQRAIQDLEGVFDQAAASLPQETRAGIRKSLDALDQAISDAATQQRALPSNPRLARYLTSVLQRKFDVLQLVTQRTTIRT